jgi:hypothetical protein
MFSESIRNNLLLNLVSEWKLDGNTNDSWGRTTSSILGNPEYKDELECIDNQCMYFDGTDDAVVIYNFSIGNIATVAFWAKSSAYDTNMPFSFNSDSYSSGPDLYFSANKISWNTGDSADNYLSIGYPNDKWHHFVLISNSVNNFSRLYIDSNFMGQASAKNTTTTNNTFYIGRYDYSTSYNFIGYIDEFQVYNAALPESEIKQNYLSGLNNLYAKGLITELEYNEKLSEL